MVGQPGVEFERTVWPHAAAMTLVVWLALAITVPLLRARLFAVAVAVCAGAAFGPLRLVATPVFGDLEFIDQQPSTTQVVWPVTVAAALSVLLIVVARRLAREHCPSDVPRGALVGVAGLVCLAIPLLALPVIPGATVDPGHEPGLSFNMVTGWGLLAGGLLAAGLLGVGRTSTAGWRVGLAVAAPGSMWWAYHRDGGWPGVPGWDYGMQSPLFLTVQITAVLIGAAALGWALRACGLGDRLRAWYDHPDSRPPPRPRPRTPVDNPAMNAGDGTVTRWSQTALATAMVMACSEGMAAVDADGTVLLANPGAELLVGPLLLGRPIWKVPGLAPSRPPCRPWPPAAGPGWSPRC